MASWLISMKVTTSDTDSIQSEQSRSPNALDGLGGVAASARRAGSHRVRRSRPVTWRDDQHGAVPREGEVRLPDGQDCMIGAPLGFDVAHEVPGPGGLPLSEKYVTIAVSIEE